MIYPTIQPDRPYVRTTVQQADGNSAVFIWGDRGWSFEYYVDKNRFRILTEEEQTGEYAKNLVSHEVVDHPEEIPDNALNENETIHAYRYGGIMSMRCGWYITPSDDFNRVLKVKLVRMS